MKLYDPVETFMGASAEEVGRDQISEEVMNEFRKKESIFSPLRKTKMDYWLSYLAYFFDINFPASFAMIVEENYLSRLEKRIPYTNPKTAEEMREVFETLDRFIGKGRPGSFLQVQNSSVQIFPDKITVKDHISVGRSFFGDRYRARVHISIGAHILIGRDVGMPI